MALSCVGEAQNEKVGVGKSGERKEKPMTKVVVRRLPPGINQEAFLSQVSPIPDYNHIYSIKGDMSLNENAFSRVYINFSNSEDIFDFKEKFDNYVFIDSKGHEYPAVVEFASFQKVPKKRNKIRVDLKSGTIESDPVYLEFLESLKSQPNKDEKPEYSYQPTVENKNDSSTPLLDYVKQRQLDKQRIREEKREERRKKDIERRKTKDDDRKKRYDERSPSKYVAIKAYKSETKENENKSKSMEGEEVMNESKIETVEDKYAASFKSRERKYEDKRPISSYKPKYSRIEKDYHERKEYKTRRDEYRDRDYRKTYDDFKKDPEKFTKKVKKYSEKREERKSTMKRIEEKAAEISTSQNIKEEPIMEETEVPLLKEVEVPFLKEVEVSLLKEVEVPLLKDAVFSEEKCEETKKPDDKSDDAHSERKTSESENESKSKNKENDPRIQRRIRNKDRPTMAIYQPGMLRKKGSDASDEKIQKLVTAEKEV